MELNQNKNKLNYRQKYMFEIDYLIEIKIFKLIKLMLK